MASNSKNLRNQKCPCGSGLKFKRCCYLKEDPLADIFEKLNDFMASDQVKTLPENQMQEAFENFMDQTMTEIAPQSYDHTLNQLHDQKGITKEPFTLNRLLQLAPEEILEVFKSKYKKTNRSQITKNAQELIKASEIFFARIDTGEFIFYFILDQTSQNSRQKTNYLKQIPITISDDPENNSIGFQLDPSELKNEDKWEQALQGLIALKIICELDHENSEFFESLNPEKQNQIFQIKQRFNHSILNSKQKKKKSFQTTDNDRLVIYTHPNIQISNFTDRPSYNVRDFDVSELIDSYPEFDLFDAETHVTQNSLEIVDFYGYINAGPPCLITTEEFEELNRINMHFEINQKEEAFTNEEYSFTTIKSGLYLKYGNQLVDLFDLIHHECVYSLPHKYNEIFQLMGNYGEFIEEKINQYYYRSNISSDRIVAEFRKFALSWFRLSFLEEEESIYSFNFPIVGANLSNDTIEVEHIGKKITPNLTLEWYNNNLLASSEINLPSKSTRGISKSSSQAQDLTTPEILYGQNFAYEKNSKTIFSLDLEEFSYFVKYGDLSFEENYEVPGELIDDLDKVNANLLFAYNTNESPAESLKTSNKAKPFLPFLSYSLDKDEMFERLGVNDDSKDSIPLSTAINKYFLDIKDKHSMLRREHKKTIKDVKIKSSDLNKTNNTKENLVTYDFESTSLDSVTFRAPNNFPLIRKVLRSLLEGIGSLWGDYAKEMIVSTPEYRSTDLKILRHSGFARFFIGQILNNADELHKLKPVPRKKKIKATLEAALETIGKTSKKKNQEPEALKISQKLSKALVSRIEELFFQIIPNTQWLHGSGDDKTIVHYQSHTEAFSIYQKAYTLICASIPSKKFFQSRIQDIYLMQSEHIGYKNVKPRYQLPTFYLGEFRLKTPYPIDLFELTSLSDAEIKIQGNKLNELPENLIKSEIGVNESKQGIDWASLNPKVFFDGQEITKETAQRLFDSPIMEHGGQFYFVNRKKMPTVEWLVHFWNRIQEKQDEINSSRKIKNAHTEERQMHVVLEMLSAEKLGIPIIGGKLWKETSAKFRELEERSQKLPIQKTKWAKSLKSKVLLKEYQKKGVQWLVDMFELNLGGVLADDMGLGKTLQVLCLVDYLRSESRISNCLIVVPTSLIFNWKNEAKKFFSDLEINEFDGSSGLNLGTSPESNSRTKIYITTYNLMQRNSEKLSDVNWDLVIFDEGQNLKNLQSKRRKAAFDLKSNSKFVLSGTPLENNLLEFYSLVDLVVPGSLSDPRDFSHRFSLGSKRSSITKDSDLIKKILVLKQATSPLIVRRTKNEILDELPEKTESITYVDFEKKQKKIYRDLAIAGNDKVQSLIESNSKTSADSRTPNASLEMLTVLLRLRQACSCPSLIPKTEYKILTPKIEQVVEKITDLTAQGEDVIVFVNFKGTLNKLKELLLNNSINVDTIDGTTAKRTREKIINDFVSNSDENDDRTNGDLSDTFLTSQDSAPKHGKVLAMTLKTGGVGLNLVNARYIFHIEPWWNPAAENQGTDRVHRIGQKRKVFVYRYIVTESIEEKIQELKNYKSELFEGLLSNKLLDQLEGTEVKKGSTEIKDTSFNASKKLSKEDFLFLATPPAE